MYGDSSHNNPHDGPQRNEQERGESQHEDFEQIDVTEISRQGYQHMKENRVSEAIQCFRSILDVDPYNNYALVGIGDAYRKRKRFQESIQYYQKCLNQYPQNNYALFGLADCYRNLKQFHRAIQVWEEYLLLDDKNVTVLTRVADAYRKVKNLDRSAEIYHQVLEIEPNNPYAIIGLGHLYYDFKMYEKALSYWMRMYESQGERVDIRVLTAIGNSHRKMKTFAQGIEFFQKALEREPGNFYALFGLADCNRGLNRQDQSLENWNKILEQDPHNKVILTRAGDAYRKLGQLDTAEEYYRRALNIEFDTFAVLGLALIHKARGQMKEAVESLEKLIRDEPNGHRLYPEIIDCYLQLGDRAAARATIERYEEVCGTKHESYLYINRLRRSAGL